MITLCLGPVASAQVVVPPASEVPIPPKASTDSVTAKVDSLPKDTLQPAFGRGDIPQNTDIGSQFQWTREEFFASGALSVADLLERVPGATSFRSGWLASPKLVAIQGDFARLRIFYDGLELDNLDPRNGLLLDLAYVQLWTLDRVSIERFGNEFRVHLTSWQPDNTSPYTRTDVSTGDEDTNVYRGFYGKRFFRGGGIQAAGQQFSTTAARLGGGGDGLSLALRAGVARESWSVDAFYNRTQQARVLQPTFGNGQSIPDLGATHHLAYLRAGIGAIASGPWLQLTAANMRYAESSRRTTVAEALTRRVVSDTTDTLTSRNQYLLSAGYTKGALRLSIANRMRTSDSGSTQSPVARVEFSNSLLAATFSAERDGLRDLSRGDAAVRVTLGSRVAIAGALSRSSGSEPTVAFASPATLAARTEAGVRIGRAWISGGFMTSDTAALVAPTVFDPSYATQFAGRRTAGFASMRGPVFRAVGVDIAGIRWESARFYQPKYETHAEANIETRWIRRFPSGNFGLKAAIAYNYRGDVAFPSSRGIEVAQASGTASGLLEIRILRAVISYQVRNFAGELYQVVPGFFMPRAINFYGVRWEFMN